MGIPLQALIIEDSVDDTEFLVRALRRGGYEPEYERVENVLQMEQALDTKDWDIIFCDYHLPHFSGLGALELYHQKGLDIPFIIISGAIGEATAVAAMKAGVNDYLMKNNLARLAPAVERELREAEVHRERRKAEQALRESQARLSEAQELAHLGSFSLDIETGITDASAEARRIIHAAPDKKITLKNIIELVHPDDRELYLKKLNNIFGEKQEEEMEGRLISPDGSVSWVHVRAAQRLDEQGKIYAVFGTIMDISERKRMEDSILISQKMADLGTLAAGVAHEINSPLQVITGTSEVLLDRVSQNEPIDLGQLKHKLDMIHRNAWRVAEIVRALLMYSRISTQRSRESNLNEIVTDCLLLIEHQLKSWSNVTIQHEFADDLPPLVCDQNQVIQALINLLTNARDAMPFGGVITLRTFYERKKERVAFQVRDTGTGIPENVRARIFDPFFTTKEMGSGTGLGLSIVQGIVKSHGGEIDVCSVPGEGSAFTLYFPILIEKTAPDVENRKKPGRYDRK